MSNYIANTQKWFQELVLRQNLCPFAHKPHQNNQIDYKVSYAHTELELLENLKAALEALVKARKEQVETILLIHPFVLENFIDYNDFLDMADQLLVELELGGVFQIASFHPHYQFAGTSFEDAENYTNRSPYPMLHLIREDSLSKAIDKFSDVDLIPERNIQVMNQLGSTYLQSLLDSCQAKDN